jgi:putative acetyltransferase
VAERTKRGKPQAAHEPWHWRGPGIMLIGLESPSAGDVVALLRESDVYHARLYPAASNHLFSPGELARDNVRFLVARSEGRAVGCGALLIGGEGEAEIKRMFVAPRLRGRQLGRRILVALESQALAESVRVVRLETGVRQPAALALYRSHRYIERGPFGSYAADPLSTFFEKRLPHTPAQ